MYDLFRQWQRNCTWQRILTELQDRSDAKGLITWDINVDSPIVRAHQHAAGAPKAGVSGKSRPAAPPSNRPDTDSDARAVV
ncbi:hypothetical protein [Streptomyces sp. NPDC046759]|uniref:hypothetical protein n=1 Tax=Streptomyces sp. NPDC046759 TaxID=3155019 RepID=UPI0033EEDA37